MSDDACSSFLGGIINTVRAYSVDELDAEYGRVFSDPDTEAMLERIGHVSMELASDRGVCRCLGVPYADLGQARTVSGPEEDHQMALKRLRLTAYLLASQCDSD